MATEGWRTGPIAITGATGQVGRALQARLATLPNEVRTVGRADDPAESFRGAAAVVHLAGALRPRKPDTYRASNVDTVAATVAALAGADVERVVFLSFLGANPKSRNEYLRTKGTAEVLLEAAGVPVTIFRCDHIIGSPEAPGPTASAFLAVHGKVRVLGSGQQHLSPVYRDDVVEAIVHAALDPSAPTGTFELAGPESLTVVDLIHSLNDDSVTIAPMSKVASRVVARAVPELPPALVDLLLKDIPPVAAAPATAASFGVTLHTVGSVWRSRRR